MLPDPAFAEAARIARASGDYRHEGCGHIGSMGAALNRMIATQMTAYPESWSEADRREMAELHLFGRPHSISQENTHGE